jgi:hypothetical protein
MPHRKLLDMAFHCGDAGIACIINTWAVYVWVQTPFPIRYTRKPARKRGRRPRSGTSV